MKTLEQPTCISYNIRTYLREIWSEDANWIHLARDKVLLRPVMNTEKCSGSVNLDKFLTAKAIMQFRAWPSS